MKLRLEKASRRAYDLSAVLNAAPTCATNRHDLQNRTGLRTAGLKIIL